jgi:geranylgeranyl pyrophosphate synthase
VLNGKKDQPMKKISTLVNAFTAVEADDQLRNQLNSTNLIDFIAARLPRADQPLGEVAAHHFKKPGKMLRVKIALRASHLLNVDKAAALHWAIAIEVLHNASLIHDDICDGDQLRRGQPAVWSKYGRDIALALGDWLIALSFELAAEAAQRSNTLMLVKLLARHMKTTTMGEAREFNVHGTCSWQNYLEISADKTAPLFIAPFEGAAAMALHDVPAKSIGSYFRCLGNAYQVANDILNFQGDDGAVSSGSDLIRRAPNAVIVIFREGLDDVSKVRFDNWYLSGSQDNYMQWQNKIIASSAMNTAALRMQKLIDDSEQLANKLPAELVEIIIPIQQMLQHECRESTGILNSLRRSK